MPRGAAWGERCSGCRCLVLRGDGPHKGQGCADLGVGALLCSTAAPRENITDPGGGWSSRRNPLFPRPTNPALPTFLPRFWGRPGGSSPPVYPR